MNAPELASIAVVAPLAIAALLVLVAPLRRSGALAATLSIVGALASLGSSLGLLWLLLMGDLMPTSELTELSVSVERQWIAASGDTVARIGLLIDGVSIPMMCVVAFVATMVQVFSLGYLADEPDHDKGRYFTWQSLFLFSMMGLVVSPNLLQLFATWELVGLCSYLLIGYWWRRPAAAKAAVKAFWVTKFADMGLLVGLVALYVQTGSFEWGPESVRLLVEGGLITLVAGGFFFAVMGKSAQVPLHVWLPDAMEGPTPVSALLHAATMVAAGVYLVVRAWPIFQASPDVMVTMSTIGGLTAFLAACMAVVQTDIKRVLAYSTCSQLGYMLAALGAGSLMGGYFHLTTHAFFKALLFLGAGSVIHAVHTNEMSEMGGLWRPMKLTAGVFGIGALALAGAPFLSGFVSKDLVLEALLHAATHGLETTSITGEVLVRPEPVLWFPFLACLLTVFLTAYYMANLYLKVFFGRASRRAYRAHEGDWTMWLPMVLLAVPSLLGGFGVSLFAQFLGVQEMFSIIPHGPVPFIGLIMAVAGLALAAALHLTQGAGGLVSALSPIGALIRLAPIDRTYDFLYRQSLNISLGVGWFDRYVIDGLVNATGGITLILGRWSRTLQTGRVGDYVYAVVGGLVLLSAWGQVMFWLVQ